MKFAVAQVQSFKGDIEANVRQHINAITIAAGNSAAFIVFPELSITGYEPTLAGRLAMNQYDTRLHSFQQSSDELNIHIAVGIPTRDELGIHISMVIFQPGKERLVYSKKYLHKDEEPYFSSGTNFPTVNINGKKIALAICYELSVPEHSLAAMNAGAEIYLASVAKTAEGVESASRTLGETAKRYQIPAIMCNAIGPADNFINAGSSAVWNCNGQLIAKLSDNTEAVLLFDSENETASSISL